MVVYSVVCSTLHSMETDPKQNVYKSGKKPKCVPEKKVIYETLCLLQTAVFVTGRTFTRQYV